MTKRFLVATQTNTVAMPAKTATVATATVGNSSKTSFKLEMTLRPMALPVAGGWNLMITGVLSNPGLSVILPK